MDNSTFIKKSLQLLEEKLTEQPAEEFPVLRKDRSPEDIYSKFDFSIDDHGAPAEEILYVLSKVIDMSVDTRSPVFMNQMYGSTTPASIVGDWVTTILNTSMYTYEVAPLLTLMERECIRLLSGYVWPDGGDGVLTPGGSISNMQAIVFARNFKFPDSPTTGIPQEVKPAIYVSDQAHYSFKKGAIFLGFGRESVFEVETDSYGRVIPEALEKTIQDSIDDGFTPMMCVGISGTTIAGFFDDLHAVEKIARKYEMWFHVDAVYGGSLLLSEKTRKRLSGIENADSVSWNLHKISGIPLVCSVVLTNRTGVLDETFSIEADYLFHEEDAALDLGQKSIQCGRRVDALKLWTAWKKDGKQGFAHRVDELMRGANELASYVVNCSDLKLYQRPESPIVLFRYEAEGWTDQELDELNKKIRTRIFKDGRILFNFTNLVGKTWIRCVISNPDFGVADARAIVDAVCAAGHEVVAEELKLRAKT